MRCFGLSSALILPFLLGGCAAEVAFDPEYVSPATPSYLAEAEIVILLHDHDLEYVYDGAADSLVGQSTSLTMPIGDIMREISAHVFQSCFMFGVVFTEELVPDMRYIIAIEPEIRDFSYRFDRRIEEGFVDVTSTDDGFAETPFSTITPSVQFEVGLTAYNSSGDVVLENTYQSGRVAGESYVTSNRPYELINATFHAALQDIMLTVAEDIRPLLVGECTITDVAG